MSQRSEIVGIQYLRGFCATMVVFDHTSGMATFPKYFGRTVLNGALSYGALGVDIFFVISGFIISMVALQGTELTPSLSRKSFFSKRFARIVPLMWVAIVSYLLLRMMGTRTQIVPSSYLSAMVLWPDGPVEPGNIWTLRHELIFYILFALSFLGRPRLRWLIAFWTAAPVAIALFSGGLAGGWIDLDPVSIVFSPVNLEFGAGLLLGLAWLKRPVRADLDLKVHPFLVMGALSIALIAIMASTGLPTLSVAHAAIVAVLAFALVWLGGRARCPDDRLSRFGRLLGNASYAIYLFHPHLVSAMLGVASKYVRHAPVGLMIVLIAVAATACCVAIHWFVEKPLVRLAQKYLSPKPAMPPIVVRAS